MLRQPVRGELVDEALQPTVVVDGQLVIGPRLAGDTRQDPDRVAVTAVALREQVAVEAADHLTQALLHRSTGDTVLAPSHLVNDPAGPDPVGQVIPQVGHTRHQAVVASLTEHRDTSVPLEGSNQVAGALGCEGAVDAGGELGGHAVRDAGLAAEAAG